MFSLKTLQFYLEGGMFLKPRIIFRNDSQVPCKQISPLFDSELFISKVAKQILNYPSNYFFGVNSAYSDYIFEVIAEIVFILEKDSMQERNKYILNKTTIGSKWLLKCIAQLWMFYGQNNLCMYFKVSEKAFFYIDNFILL